MTIRRGVTEGSVWAPKGLCGRNQGAFLVVICPKAKSQPEAGRDQPQTVSRSLLCMGRACFSSRPVKWIPRPRLRGAGRHRRRGKDDEWASLQSLKVPRGRRELETEPRRAGQVGGTRARNRSRATRPACGRGPWMEASVTQGIGEQPDQQDDRGRWTGSLGHSGHQPPAPRPKTRPMGLGQGRCWPLAGMRLW